MDGSNLGAPQRDAIDYVERNKQAVADLTDAIFYFAEPGMQEIETCKLMCELLAEAEKRLAELKCHNVTALCGDGTRGWPEQAPFPRILVTAAAPEMPAKLIDQLDEGGIMVVPIGASVFDQWIYRVRREQGRIHEERLSQVRFVPLVPGAAASA